MGHYRALSGRSGFLCKVITPKDMLVYVTTLNGATERSMMPWVVTGSLATTEGIFI